MNLSIATLHLNSKAFSKEGKGGGRGTFFCIKDPLAVQKTTFFEKNLEI